MCELTVTLRGEPDAVQESDRRRFLLSSDVSDGKVLKLDLCISKQSFLLSEMSLSVPPSCNFSFL